MSSQQNWGKNAGTQSAEVGSNTSATQFRFPPPHSLAGKLLADMLDGDYVSRKRLCREFGMNLSNADVQILRKCGWPVQETCTLFPDPHDGSPRLSVMLYSLPLTTILAAGTRGQRFALKVMLSMRHKRYSEFRNACPAGDDCR